jgi:uncharacterized membrane protein YedE/YeeE
VRTLVVAFVAGLVFAGGLALSGMTDPAKVIGFLDVTGSWDPSLALVMGGALAVFVPGFRLLRRRAAPVFAPRFMLPRETPIDAQLVGGAAVFGIGWGLVGLCPGPAVASLAAGSPAAWFFVVGMVAALAGYERVRQLAGRSAAVAPSQPEV